MQVKCSVDEQIIVGECTVTIPIIIEYTGFRLDKVSFSIDNFEVDASNEPGMGYIECELTDETEDSYLIKLPKRSIEGFLYVHVEKELVRV